MKTVFNLSNLLPRRGSHAVGAVGVARNLRPITPI